MLDSAVLNASHAVVGERGLLTGASTAGYVEDWRRLYRGRTPAVVRPASTDELARVVRLWTYFAKTNANPSTATAS